MKKILSFDYSRKIGVVLKKKRNSLYFENEIDFSSLEENKQISNLEKLIKKYSTILSVETENYINQEVSLPPVKDKKTREFILKNKLKDSLETGKNYKFILIPEKNIEKHIIYNVYAVPTNVLIENVKININLKKKLEKFLLSPFSLLGISNFLFPEKVIFHVYADKKNLIITVSSGKNLKYTRTVYIPENLEEEQILNILYENINLTYQYVIQNKSKKIDLILFSGFLSNNEKIADMSYSFLKLPIASIYKESLIKNCEKEKFDKYLIPIGNYFVPDLYNLLPDEFIEEQNFNKILISANFILIFIILYLIFENFSKYEEFKQNISLLDHNYTKLNKEIEKFRKEYNIPEEKLDYYFRYFNNLSQLEQANILKSFSDIKKLVFNTDIKNLNIEEKDNSIQINIVAVKKFKDLKQFVDFKGKIKKEIQNLSKNYILQDNTIYMFDQLKIILRLSLSKNIGAG